MSNGATIRREFVAEDLRDCFEALDGKLKYELLNGELFYTLLEARVIVEKWRTLYDTTRPHMSLGGRPPTPAAIGVGFDAIKLKQLLQASLIVLRRDPKSGMGQIHWFSTHFAGSQMASAASKKMLLSNHPMKKLFALCFALFINYAGAFAADPTDPKNVTLIKAAMIGKTDDVRKALKEGADINARGDKNINWTPLMWSISRMGSKEGRKDAIKMFKFLLKSGADVNQMVSDKGFTALHVAIANLQKDEALLLKVVGVLLKKGANPNKPDSSEIKTLQVPAVTPLMEAARRGLGKTVSLLIAFGADVNAKSKTGTTPLGYAEDKAVIDLLKKAGAQ